MYAFAGGPALDWRAILSDEKSVMTYFLIDAIYFRVCVTMLSRKMYSLSDFSKIEFETPCMNQTPDGTIISPNQR